MDRQAKIYLDTLVWVRLKETVLGKGKPEEEALLECLRKIVRQRKGLCVSHFHSLMEVGRQRHADLLRWAEATPLMASTQQTARDRGSLPDWSEQLVAELLASGALRQVDDWVLDA